MAALRDGVGSGLRLLLDSGTDTAERLQGELGGQHAPDEVGRLGTEGRALFSECSNSAN